MHPDEIEGLIRAGLPGARVRVVDETGTGDHFAAVVVASAFAGKSLVERHQMVYGSLGGAMADRIHALSLKAYTPEEWARTQEELPVMDQLDDFTTTHGREHCSRPQGLSINGNHTLRAVSKGLGGVSKGARWRKSTVPSTRGGA